MADREALAAIGVDGLDAAWEADPAGASALLARVDAVIDAALIAHEGVGFRLHATAVKAVFPDAARAAAFGVETLAALDALLPRPPRVVVGPGPAGSAAEAALLRRLRIAPPGRVLGPDGPLAQVGPLALPRATSSFHGRDDAVEEAVAGLVEPGWRTLVGPGGVGKTRTACRIAARLHARLAPAGGTRFVDLAAETELSGVVAAVAAAADLDVGGRGGPAEAQARLQAGLAVLGRTVWVLDNIEQLDPPALAALAERPASLPQAHLLATSRVPGPTGTDQRLGGLSSSAARTLLARRAATRGVADWLDGHDADALIDALDRLPLALELAAARADLLSPADLLARLGPGTWLPGPEGAARHESLHAMIHHSWALLDADVQRTLWQLGAFRGGFTMDEAEAVVRPAAPVLEHLATLRDASLLVATPPTYRLLETVRAYVRGRFEATAGAAEVASRHRRLLMQGRDVWQWGLRRADRPLQLQTVGRQRPDLVHLVEAGGADAAWAVLRLDPWIDRQHPSGVRLAWLDRGVAAASSTGDPALLAMLLGRRGQCLTFAGPASAAQRDLEQAQGLAAEAGSPILGAWICVDRAVASTAAGQPERAVDLVARAERSAPEDPGILGAVALLRAELSSRRGAFAEAAASHRLALAHLADAELPVTAAQVRAQYAATLAFAGEQGEALRESQRAVDDLGALDHPRLLEAVKRHRNGVLEAMGRWSEAVVATEEALAKLRRRGEPVKVVFQLWNLASLYAALDRHDEAMRMADEAVARSAVHDMGEYIAFCQLQRILVLFSAGLDDDARAALADVPDDPDLVPWMWMLRAVLAAEAGQRGAAREGLWRAAETIWSGDVDLLTMASATVDVLFADDATEPGQVVDRARAVCVRPTRSVGAPFYQRLGDVVRRWDAAHGTPVRIRRDGGRVWLPSGQAVDLTRRAAPRRILAMLLEGRLQHPGRAQPLDAVLAAGWPGERVLPSAATNRVYVAIATLRKVGLAGILLTTEEGYLLDPDVPTIAVDDPEPDRQNDA